MAGYIDSEKIRFDEIGVAPATPATGQWLLYAKATGIYTKDDAGTESLLGGGMTSFDAAADSGTPAEIGDGETLTFAGGTGLTSVISGNTVTHNFNGLSLTTETIQAWKLLDNTALGSNGSFDIDISSGEALNCEHLELVMLIRSTNATQPDIGYVFFNNDTTTTNYYSAEDSGVAGTPASAQNNLPRIGVIPAADSTSGNFNLVRMYIPDFRGSKQKVARFDNSFYSSTSAMRTTSGMFKWNSASAITRIQVRMDGHATDLLLTASEIWLYGLKSLSVVTNVTVL